MCYVCVQKGLGLTWVLVVSSLAAVLGGSVPNGFNTGVLNAPEKVFMRLDVPSFRSRSLTPAQHTDALMLLHSVSAGKWIMSLLPL